MEQFYILVPDCNCNSSVFSSLKGRKVFGFFVMLGGPEESDRFSGAGRTIM